MSRLHTIQTKLDIFCISVLNNESYEHHPYAVSSKLLIHLVSNIQLPEKSDSPTLLKATSYILTAISQKPLLSQTC